MDEDSVPVSRRTILAGAGALAASSILPVQLEAAAEKGVLLSSPSALGGWTQDSQMLPAYRFVADLPIDTRDAGGAAFPLDPDPFFLIGNYKISVFTHASGLFTILTGERGWTRVNEPLPGTDQNAASIEVTRDGKKKLYQLLGLKGVAADDRRSGRQFGCGYVRYDLKPDEGLRVVRTLSVAPSDDKVLGGPAFVINVQITNRGPSSCDVAYEESVLSRSALVIDRGADDAYKAVHFTNRVESDESRSFIVSHATGHSDDPGIISARNKANRYNLYPPSLALVYPMGAAQNRTAPISFSKREAASGATELQAVATSRLAAGETRTLVFVVGLCPENDPAELLDFAGGLAAAPEGIFFGKAWQAALATFEATKDPVFRRELTWSTHALLAMATYNSFYDETFIPQGMTYDYQMDLTAAPRDHFQHAMAACYFRPSLAKSTLRYALSKITVQGKSSTQTLGSERRRIARGTPPTNNSISSRRWPSTSGSPATTPS